MDTQYHQFRSSERSSRNEELKITTQPGNNTCLKNIVIYILYGILVLLLLILLMVTGIQFSQLNKEIRTLKHLVEFSHGGTSSSSSSVKEVVVENGVGERGSCRSGWVSFQRSCYMLSNTGETWSRAEEQCKAEGGHLVVVNNVEELDYLSSIIETHLGYWIGLVERQNEGHWSWVDGTDYNSTATFWDVGQPDNWGFGENGEDCGQFHASQMRKRKLWNDADCNLKCRFICETKV